MTRYIVQRLVQAVGVVLLVSVFVFALVRLIPGDPVSIMLGENLSPEVERELIRKWGLDRPIFEQYVAWLANLVRGDLGQSIRTQESVGQLIAARIPATSMLAVGAMIIAIGIGIPAGVVAAYRANTGLDYAAMLAALVGLCVPSFWLGLLLMLLFSLRLGWFPVSGYVSPLDDLGASLRHLVLPALALGVGLSASISRMTRSAMLDVLRQDYVRTARAKGLSERATVLGHALRNALMPTITVIGLQLGFLLGGSVVVEEIFGYPGVGQLLVFAINNRDYPLIQGVVMIFALTFVIVNLLVDLSYAYLDPRIKYS
ncbi:ABC transporter permease [Sphaerobacter thermophilus]|jgi:peptide/nickel transport system permease protein|uniref:Binding-protein-dependent transport systems inner membrane component n=1 Tax=Sphaerobacter thermophilus (strain ATCC 49802 / DSM 20745 / KCCM 41009 / NCIMB 13125 / S 6022) TaxID=479434 RepID=D1C2E3_SPHTD|nr:ABC transporter permease [Sphaerobacter thermophilus]ACZ38410.1 binding-protein-dependent transport systems inner membrane component [Sphaerobacter thermophilus DSM 20745]PZN67142.1 MAG: ABC transporter permease [Sphaerobacter thermophilus]HLU37438.1 ABC transporter permease [Thermomicrobiales bacterium]